MNIEKTARRIVDQNAPSAALLESTLGLMHEAQWAEAARPQKKKRRGLRRFALSTGACAALFALLIGTNALFPAFAESLPLVGGIFRQVNVNGSRNLQDTQGNIQSYAQPLAPAAEEEIPTAPEDESDPLLAETQVLKPEPIVTLDVAPNNEGEQNVHITVEEAYYDGYFLFAGLRMEIEKEYPECYNRIYDIQIPGYDLLINGSGCYTWNEKGGRGGDVPGFAALGYQKWDRTGDREYICQRGFLLPEEYWGQDSLDIELVYKGFFTYDPYRDMEEGDDNFNTSDFSLRFTAQKNDAPIKEIDCTGMSQNGMTVVKALTTPAATLFIADYESRYDHPVIGSILSDGYSLGGQGQCIPQDLGNGYIRDIGVWGGMREEEDRAVYLGLFDKNGSNQREAAFKLDFQAGTIQPCDVSEVPEPANYAWWDDTDEAGDIWRLESVTVESGEGRWMITGPIDGYHSLCVDMYQEGQLLDQSESTRNESSHVIYDDEGIDYWIYNGRFWASLNPNEPVDVKIRDMETGQMLLETTITLEKW